MKISLIFFEKTLDFFACIAYNIDSSNDSRAEGAMIRAPTELRDDAIYHNCIYF